jgi:hypothetical protein
MARYTITTLIDITRTQPTRSETDKIKLGQQSNFNSLIQAIGLRANISWEQDPKMNTGSIPTTDGKANHWIWEFDTERDDSFLKGSDPVGLLVDDLHGVPVITLLKETADINPAAFITKGENSNTWIK